MSATGDPFDTPREQRDTWLRAVSEFVHDALDARTRSPSAGPLGADADAVAEAVSRSVPEEPLPGGIDAVLALLQEAASVGLSPGHAGYLAYVPGTGLFASALADLISGALNRFTGLTAASPALCRLEADVLRWLARECGYGDDAGGVLLSGGSLANLAAVITAREERLGDGADLRRATAYATPQAHHCVTKAFRLAGLPAAGVRTVPVDDEFRMDVDALATLLAEDRASGHAPVVVVASAGTTNTGAIDDLDAVADVCAADGVWLHVDGAYGGAFVLCDAGRARLAGMSRADSIALDPHKGLFLPFGTGCLLVRDGAALRRTHALGAGYLRDFDDDPDAARRLSPTEHGPELSRSFRGLRLWMPLMLHGAGAFRSALQEKIALADIAHAGLLELVERGAPLEIVAAPQLSTLAFRLQRGDDEALTAWNVRNIALVEAVNGQGRVHLSTTFLPVTDGEAVTLRVCVLGAATDRERIDMLLEDVGARASGPTMRARH